MANFYTDHPEIKFNLESSPLMQRIVELKENGYADKDSFDYAPEDYADAIDSYNRVLEVAGDITANTVFPNSEDGSLKARTKAMDAKFNEAIEVVKSANNNEFTDLCSRHLYAVSLKRLILMNRVGESEA